MGRAAIVNICDRQELVQTNDKHRTVALWWLPLVAGLLPALATIVAFRLAVAQGQFESCNPLIDGCVSISRAARHDLPNILFRALILPAATLQAMVWLLTPAWLRGLGDRGDRLLRLLPFTGVIAAAFLVLYGTFLGTEGPGYQWMRRYGVVVYFGFTCIAMLIVAGASQRVTAATGQLRHVGAALYVLVALLPGLGIVNVTAPLYLESATARDALENVAEWWGGLVFTAFFVLLASLWRSTRFAALVGAHRR